MIRVIALLAGVAVGVGLANAYITWKVTSWTKAQWWMFDNPKPNPGLKRVEEEEKK